MESGLIGSLQVEKKPNCTYLHIYLKIHKWGRRIMPALTHIYFIYFYTQTWSERKDIYITIMYNNI